MDSLPARLARREALRARARVLSRVYVRAARALHRLWLRARATKAPADQEAYHAGLLVRAAKLDRFCGVLAEMQDGGDDSWVDLHRETKANGSALRSANCSINYTSAAGAGAGRSANGRGLD
jgi:hypothetical protein